MIVLEFHPYAHGKRVDGLDRFTQFMWYAGKKLAAGLIIVFLLISAGFIGYDCANVYVIVHDGMAQRMAVITETSSDPSVMNKYFTADCMSKDPMLTGAVPDGVLVKDYSYSTRIKKLWVWPWKSRTRVIVRDEVSRLNLAPVEEGGYVPDTLSLGTGEMKIHLIKQDGRWYIDGLELTRTQEELEAEEALRNPTPSPESSPGGE